MYKHYIYIDTFNILIEEGDLKSVIIPESVKRVFKATFLPKTSTVRWQEESTLKAAIYFTR